MKPLYQTNHLATAIYTATLIAWVILELVGRARHGGLVGRDRSEDRGTRLLVGLTTAVGLGSAYLVASRVAGAAIGGRDWPVLAAGFGLMWTGIGLRLWSIRTLGRFFTYEVTIQQGQRVVSSGPYRVVRHPSYTGLLLTEAGIGLALGNWFSLALAVVVPLVGILCRIGVEEAALRAGLGDSYSRYAQGRRRLIPGVW